MSERPNPRDLSAAQIKAQLERARARRKRLRRVLDNLEEWMRRASAVRKRKLRRKRRQSRRDQGPRPAMKWAASKVGTTESPAGSNLGPGADGITEQQRYTGYNVPPGVYWCGCFVCWAVVKVGGALIPARHRLGYNGYIVDDATRGVNGLRRVGFDQAAHGDIVTFTFPHIALVDRREGEYLYTIEGNTSAEGASGSQNNGGGIFRRKRHMSLVACVARPDWP